MNDHEETKETHSFYGGGDTHTTQAGPQCHCLLASNVAEEGGQRETAISGKHVCVTLVFPAAQGE